MTEGSKKVFEYLKENAGNMDLTHKMVAEALGVSSSTVTGSINGLVKKGLATREEATIMNDKEKEVTVKYIRLEEAAYAFDPDAKVDAKAKA